MNGLCQSCSTELSPEAVYCPQCGAKQDLTKGRGGVLPFIVVPFLLAGIAIAALQFGSKAFSVPAEQPAPSADMNSDSQIELPKEESIAQSGSGLEGELERAIEAHPNSVHCEQMSEYLAENLQEAGVLTINNSPEGKSVTPKTGFENLFAENRSPYRGFMNRMFCPGDIDVKVLNFFNIGSSAEAINVKYSWTVVNMPKIIQDMKNDGTLLNVKPQHLNKSSGTINVIEKEYDPHKELRFSGQSKTVLIKSNNGWIPQNSF